MKSMLLRFPERKEKWNSPRGDIAEIMLTDFLLPVPRTMGVRPTGAQVVPE